MATYISVADQTVDESVGYVDIVVRLSEPSTTPVSVNYTTNAATALNGSDYDGLAGTLNFAAGETTKTVRIQLLNNTSIEALEHFSFTLSDATNATLARESAMISIVDNDTIAGTPNLFVRDVTVDEKAGTVSFVVWMDAASDSAVTVDYATANATAAAGSDYLASSGSLSFAAGETVKTVVIDLIDDATAEGLEHFYLQLSNATNANLRDSQAVARIGASDGSSAASPHLSVADMVVGEADGYIDVVVSLSAPSTAPVSVSYATNAATAVNGPDYVGIANGTLNFATGETTKTVRIQLLDNTDVEALEHFRFTLSDASNASIARESAMIAIVDNDAIAGTPNLFVRDVTVDEKAGTASFVVWMDAASSSTVTVDYSTANSTAAAGSDYLASSGSLTFAAGEMTKTVVVDLIDDATAEGLEHFYLQLSNATNANLRDSQAVARIGASDGSTAASPHLSVTDMVAGEADGYIDVVVSLSAPSTAPVSVRYATDAATAVNASDYVGIANGTLNFAAGETTKTVRIQLLDDTAVEVLENLRFDLSDATNATIARDSAMIAIVDNDAIAGTPNLLVRDVIVDEKAGTASFVVWMDAASNSTVTADYTTANSTAAAGSDYLASSGSLSFAAGETTKTVVVNLIDDATAEGLERFNFRLSNATNASIRDGQAVAQIGASDGSTASSPRLSVTDMVAGEADGYIDVVVSLSAPSTAPVSVNYVTTAATAANGSDYTGLIGALNFAAGETTKTVRIQLLDDTAVEALEYFRFNLNGATNATIATGTATISIVDNDSAPRILSFGIGDDIYTVTSSTDLIVENSGGGTDLVYSSVNYTLGNNVENLVLTGTASINGTGNALANTLTGNGAANILNGGAGADTLIGGLGNDTYYVDNTGDVVSETSSSGGIDTIISSVTRTLGNYQENLTLSGTAAINAAGNDLANTLTGNGAANILNGNAGADTLIGGDGNDTYYVDHTSDVVSETSSTGGIDTVISTVTRTLGNYQENLTLSGTAAINAVGNSLANRLVGNGAANVLNAGAGADTLIGGAGADTMFGGDGNDTYYVDHVSDVVSETSSTGGIDTVISTVTRTLGNYQENLTLSGTAAINGTGNSLANTLTGNGAANVLTGGAGNDTLSGGAGNDTLSGGTGNDWLVGGTGKDALSGGAGNDIFDFNALNETGLTSTAWDVITDFTRGQDKIDLSTLDANTATTTNDAFNSVIGSTTAFTAAGQLKVVSGVLYGNTDADSSAEFAIQLTGITSLALSDFTL